MRVFVEIVDRGSLTAAAESLDRSQPTIVRTLAALESHLGVPLLRRTTRRMSLTAEGRDFLERSRRILADVDEAESAVRRQHGTLRGDLRVTAPVQFGQLHVAPAVFSFLREHPRIRVELLLVDRIVDLVEEGIDLAVRIGPLTDSSMVATRLGEVRRVVCASPTLLAETGTPDHPAELRELPCIRQRNLTHPTAWTFHEGPRRFSVPVGGSFSSNQVAVSTAACVDGLGFAQFLSYQVRHQVRAGRLETVLEGFEPPPWPVSLAYPGGRIVSARLRALIDCLRNSLTGSDAFA
jgi:DNA-binding transcriptional LysR family regulator